MCFTLVLHAVCAERRGPTKSHTSVSLPLERLEPHTPELCQLVSQWQKLWVQAHSRQTKLEEHQQRLREVITVSVLQHSCIKYYPNWLYKLFIYLSHWVHTCILYSHNYILFFSFLVVIQYFIAIAEYSLR